MPVNDDRPFLLIQSRPEQVVTDQEYEAFLRYAELDESQLQRIHIDRGELPEIDFTDWSGILVGGGPANFATPDADIPDWQRAFQPRLFELARRVVNADFPYLGACLGLGALTHGLGGRMTFDANETVAPVEVHVSDDARDDALLRGFPDSFFAFGGHKEGLLQGFGPMVVLARSATCVHLVRVGRYVYATQFHPELDADGLETRIRHYLHNGYFDPSDADELIRAGHTVTSPWPGELLRRFIAHARARSA